MILKYNRTLLLTIYYTIIFVISTSNESYLQQITWSRTYGDTGTVSEQGVDILQTYDGNYIVLASRSYDGNNQKILLLKLDIYGNVMWEKMVADSIQHHSPYRFQETKDSGFIITGVSGSAFLIKTDKNGNLKWRRIYADTYPQTYSFSVITTQDNGFIFCGRVPFFSPPSDRGYIVKTDSAGNVQWERVYIDSLFTDYFEIIQTKEKSGYFVVGRTYNITQPITFYTITKKLTLGADIIWSNTYGKNSTGLNVMILDDTSLIISSSKQNPFSPRIFRIDTNGTIIWDSSYTSPSFSGSFPYICKDLQNNIQKVGGINGNITYSEISPTGSQLVLRPFQTSGFLATYGEVIKGSDDGGFIVVGGVAIGTQSHPKIDILVLKTDSLANAPALVKIVNNNVSYVPENYQLFQNYPNPFNSNTLIRFKIPKISKIKIIICDLIGKEITKLVNQTLESGDYSVNFNSQALGSGVYFYMMIIENKILECKKMLIIK